MVRKNKDLYAVILAGGTGTRFWPLSRQKNPKQFISIAGPRTLFEQTLLRIKPIVLPGNIFIVTNKAYKEKIRKYLTGFKIPPSQILLEPQARNTAPAICWAALRIHAINPKATMMVLPSDHLIGNQEVFIQSVTHAFECAQKGFLITLGIVPTRAETGYGYIKVNRKSGIHERCFRVEKFVEKPTLIKAKQFLRTKKYFWNSGMFVWRTEVVLGEFKKYLPKIYSSLKKTKQNRIPEIYKKLPNISVDYGILEKVKELGMVPSLGMQWSDLGSWEALWQVLNKDKRNNVLRGNVIDCLGEENLIFGNKRLIAAIGLKNIIIIDTPEALLVCRKDLSQNVRNVVDLLKDKKQKIY